VTPPASATPSAESFHTLLGVEQSVQSARWVLRSHDERIVLALTQRLRISDTLARVLAGRGIELENAEHFLSPSLKHSLPDPLHLKDMDKAVTRIAHAIIHHEKIGVFGDYDVDGATSSALLLRYLEALNVHSDIHIPDRQTEGYGPNFPALAALQALGCSLVITVDCGASAFEPLQQARDSGLDVVVLDHHIGSPTLPEAVAVVNPNRLDETTPHNYLAAVGVTFLTLIALNRHLREQGWFATQHLREPPLLEWLDIVALGTVCDVVPLIGANRAIVTQGLKVMSARRNLGITALIDSAGVTEGLSAYHAGFVIGPRINAGGRVGHASYGAQILSSHDPAQAHQLANALNTYNAERKAIEMLVQEEAEQQAESQHNRAVIMVYAPHWHQGVIGIVAGRLKEKFHKPVAVLTHDNGIIKASARSIHGVDLGAAIVSARVQGLLLAGGGHAMAAGFSLDPEQLGTVHDYLEQQLQHAVWAAHEDRMLKLDAVVSLHGATAHLAKQLQLAAPYGVGNPAPRIALSNVRITKWDLLKDAHLRLQLSSAEGSKGWLKAMAFRVKDTPLGNMLFQAGSRPLHLAGQLQLEHWQGRENATFHIEDAAFA
jgi:single-stranded-DNA-specific exonuclease